MGLDNGITMKVKIKAEWAEILGIKESEFEIAYWRKCWNFRNDVMEYFDSSSEEYAYPMTMDDLEGIEKIISEQIDNKVSETIWDKKETKSIHKANRRMIRDCMLLNAYGGEMAMVKYVISQNIIGNYNKIEAEALMDVDLNEVVEDVELYFYDSY